MGFSYILSVSEDFRAIACAGIESNTVFADYREGLPQAQVPDWRKLKNG